MLRDVPPSWCLFGMPFWPPMRCEFHLQPSIESLFAGLRIDGDRRYRMPPSFLISPVDTPTDREAKDEKLLEILELAMLSDTTETVKRARELLDLGVDPIVLMSQLVTLIMDIIAGTHPIFDAKQTDTSTGESSDHVKSFLGLSNYQSSNIVV
ncbi:hypothetical protein CQW23_04059 [Capsicum baccatum]|uniref:Uncharacterized protein n=1 Tax=Capsicum baccatum TaxID=33114 RepID=A0A2G2XDJ9_CAPBA|nr:hypothetical protein CQW23_04059 [Capsicum baccatum]